MPYTMTADLIAALESGTRCGAMRFEPGVYGRLDVVAQIDLLRAIATKNHCSANTAQMIFSTSWGLFQIMGMNLYSNMNECPSIGSDIFSFCQSAILQHNYFEAFIRAKGICYTIEELKVPSNAEHFGKIYNGDGKAYGAKILEYLR